MAGAKKGATFCAPLRYDHARPDRQQRSEHGSARVRDTGLDGPQRRRGHLGGADGTRRGPCHRLVLPGAVPLPVGRGTCLVRGDGVVITAAEALNGWQAARPEESAHVERILARLPGREREMVEAMAATPAGERSATDVARAMRFESASQAGPTAQRLDTIRGIINRGRPEYTFRHRAIEAYLTTDWPDDS